MSKTFKIYKHPINNQGLHDGNTFFVDSINGSDSNPGTREAPRKTIIASWDKTNNVIRGNFYGEFECLYLIGEGNYIENLNTSHSSDIYNVVVNNLTYANALGKIYNCVIKNSLQTNFNWSVTILILKNTLIINYKCGYIWNESDCTNNTFVNLHNCIGHIDAKEMYNSIIVKSFELYNTVSTEVSKILIFKHCLFLKTVQFKWKGSVIPVVYGETPANWISDLKTSLTTFAQSLAGDEKAYLEAMIASSFDNTNRIYDDSGKTLFCKYNNDEIIDYSLSKDCGFPLTMSSQNNYVGAYNVGLPSPELTGIYDVDANGDNTSNTPDLLLHENGTFTSNINSTQLHNRAEFAVEHFPRGFSFSGFQSYFATGLANRVYIGKKQTLDQNNLPIETVEIIPYDNPTTPSVNYPRFSAELTGKTEMFYLVSENRPLLFNDLSSIGIVTDKDLTLYGDWAVTTADYESFLLKDLSTVTTKRILIFYFKKEINMHYAAE